MKTYTLDAKLPNGRYASDSGLTESEVAAARQNADRLGIEILSITEEVPVSPEDLNAFRNPQ